MPKEDKAILSLVLIAVAYFGMHVAWALIHPWLVSVSSAVLK